MKAKFTKDKCLKITSETPAEYMALSHMCDHLTPLQACKSNDRRGEFTVWLHKRKCELVAIKPTDKNVSEAAMAARDC